jgi:hypothetical protein
MPELIVSMAMPVFHGTRRAQEILVGGFVASTGGEFGPGVYFTHNIDTARFYAVHVARGPERPTILEATLVLKNPYVIRKLDWIKKTKRRTPRTVQRELMKRGHDAIVGIALNDYERQIVVFDPAKIRDVRLVELVD